ncbi:NlpC/P60 family protein [Sporolactobacillus sp. THM7-4]|nr:NlpC/P60 family protein [Sporolactobacillus sp. THM7-4]
MNRKRVAVPVLTVWTDPDSVRDVDLPAVGRDADIAGWLAGMSREENIALCREKRVQTQVLFGDEVIVDEIRGDWAKIVVPLQASSRDSRGYPGWAPTVQLVSGASPFRNREQVMVQSKIAPFFSEKNEHLLDLSFVTTLSILEEEKDRVKVDSPIGPGYLLRKDIIFCDRQQPSDGQEIVKNARRFMDLPYLWAGMSAYGYDCSGFSYSMLRACGFLIPRDADDQSENGEEIDLQEKLPGDLLYFAYEEGKGYVHHVGIYAGDGKMIHSPTPGEKVSLTALAGTKFEKELCTVRRYWRKAE